MKEDKMLLRDVWERKASGITSVTEYQGEYIYRSNSYH